MKFHYIFYKSALFAAVERGNTEIANLLLKNKNVNVNVFSILHLILSIKFSVFLMNCVTNS